MMVLEFAGDRLEKYLQKRITAKLLHYEEIRVIIKFIKEGSTIKGNNIKEVNKTKKNKD